MISKPIFIDIDTTVYDKITSVQHDHKSRFLDVILISDSAPIDLTDTTAMFVVEKPDNSVFYSEAEISDSANGRLLIEITKEMTDITGNVNC